MVLLHNTGSIIFETTEKEHALPFFKDKHENPHPQHKKNNNSTKLFKGILKDRST